VLASRAAFMRGRARSFGTSAAGGRVIARTRRAMIVASRGECVGWGKETRQAFKPSSLSRPASTRAACWPLPLSKAKLDGENRVEAYLSGAGLLVERFSKVEMKHRRTPDFRVFSGRELAFYCEVKAAQEDEWLDQQLAKVPPGTVAGEARNDSTYNRVSGYVHSAVGQFDAVNPAVTSPNVLAIVNGDTEAGFTDLIQVLTGNP